MKRSLVYILLISIFVVALGGSLFFLFLNRSPSIVGETANLCEQIFDVQVRAKNKLQFVDTFIINERQFAGDFVRERGVEGEINTTSLFNQYLVPGVQSFDDVSELAVRTINYYDADQKAPEFLLDTRQQDNVRTLILKAMDSNGEDLYQEITELSFNIKDVGTMLKDNSLYMQVWPELPYDQVDVCLRFTDGTFEYVQYANERPIDLTSLSELSLEEDGAVSMKLPQDIDINLIDKSFLGQLGGVSKFNFRRIGNHGNTIFAPGEHIIDSGKYAVIRVEDKIYQVFFDQKSVFRQETEINPSGSL